MGRRRHVWIRCQKCPEQASFNVTAVAMELHKGHKDRRVLRKGLGHYCDKCLKSAEFRFVGKEFPKAKGQG